LSRRTRAEGGVWQERITGVGRGCIIGSIIDATTEAGHIIGGITTILVVTIDDVE
jgi:hypothetical protein